MTELIEALAGSRDGGLESVSPQRCAMVLDVDGVAVTLVTRHAEQLFWHLIWSSDLVSAQLNDLRFRTGDGPTAEAISVRRAVLASDLAASQRCWPMFVPSALELGVRAIFAFPLVINTLPAFGAFVAYRNRPGDLAPVEIADAEAFAEITTLVTLRAGKHPERWLQEKKHVEAEIHQAVGMIAARSGIGLGEAMVRLRAYAYANNLSLTDVARGVISGRNPLNPD